MGRDIAVALLFVYLFWPQLSLQILLSSGLAERLYGPAVNSLYTPPSALGEAESDLREAERTRIGILGGTGAARLDLVDAESRRLLRTKLTLWAPALVFPLEVISVPFVLYALGGVPPARIGLTTRRFWRNVLAGLGGWLLITPLVFAINVFVEHLTRLADPSAVQEHALTRLVEYGPTRAEWLLIALSAIVMAPVREEIIFRGVLQPWFASFRHGGATAMAIAFAATFLIRQTLIFNAIRDQGTGVLTALMPLLFVVALVPFYRSVAQRSHRPEASAIFGTALLFAAVHSNVWPSPVALFVLALALGALALWTGSLVGPIVLHGLFNAVSVVVLLLESKP